MKTDNFLLIIAIIALLVSIIGLTITYNSISTFQNLLTGYATEDGIITLEITSQASIEITHAAGFEGNKTIDWGEGLIVDDGPAFLVTNGTVNQGTWSPIDQGFIIKNIGNVNVNLSVHSNVTAEEFIGGNDPRLQYSVSNNITNSCESWSLGYNEGEWRDFTTSPNPVCDVFKYLNQDELKLDILLLIPSSAEPGERIATITLSYQATN